jgi:ppGpp synthetase/RelA/SpoT-type nucleotidyltranferase
MAKKSTHLGKTASTVISREEFQQQYNQRRPSYERLATNLQQALKSFLSEQGVSYLDVLFRVKDADSAYEKISRKEYEHPFEDIEDWSGLRIICYYPDDVAKICSILEKEFDVQTQEDTATRLAPHEFGYRSTHLILTVKDAWMTTTNYRGLGGFKAEVQVRTILMHAWAEIEHKLQYKSTEQVPEQFQRKLYRLSAKFEEADEQFDELRKGIAEYRATVREIVTDDINAFQTQELNLDTLTAFLNAAFPERERSYVGYVGDALNELIQANATMEDVVSSFDFAKRGLSIMEDDWRSQQDNQSESLTQVEALRAIIEISKMGQNVPSGHVELDGMFKTKEMAADRMCLQAMWNLEDGLAVSK